MSEKDRIANRCRNRQLFKLGSPMNAIRINTGNSYNHEHAKFEVCWQIAALGHAFITEAEFKGGRCDAVDLDEGICYEIAFSEKEASLMKKASIYPLPIEVWKVNPDRSLTRMD